MKKMTDNDFELFICRNEKKSERRELLKRALLAYGIKKEELSRAALCRTDLGKPYFEGLEIYFNISHSRDIWACLIGPDCCGLDVQYVKPCNYEKIARRFFSSSENMYIKEAGLEGFFEIWTRREAFGKYTGEGFFGEFRDFTDEKGEPVSSLDTVVFREIEVGSDIKCICCVSKNTAGHAGIKVREDF